MELAIIADEFSTAGVSAGIMNQGISMLVPTLLEVGSREQCAKWIGPTIRGEVIWCQGYSEPGSGSDLAAVKTHAYVDDGRFVINGQKIWTSSAHFADMMFLLCRTDADKGKHGGLSYLLIPMSAEGIEVRPLITMTGRAEFNETFLTNVRVPIDQIVMQRGDGWHVANVTLKYERLLLGDPNKLAHRLARVIELMRRTSLIGVPTIEIPEYRDRLLKLQGEVLASKFHGLQLLSEQSRDEAQDALPEEARIMALHAKAHVSEVGREVARLTTELHGGMGFTDLLGLHYWFKRIAFDRQILGAPEYCRREAAKVQGWLVA